jgi:hypothetical protein
MWPFLRAKQRAREALGEDQTPAFYVPRPLSRVRVPRTIRMTVHDSGQCTTENIGSISLEPGIYDFRVVNQIE